jgi:hypothetical protein
MTATRPIVLLLTWFVLAPQQTVHESARAAALRYAVDVAPAGSRLTVPKDSVVVARETEFAQYSFDYSRTGPKMSIEQEAADAVLVAQTLQPGTRAVAAAAYLECIRYDCAASQRYSVVLVRPAALFDDGYRVAITVWHPGSNGDRSRRTMEGAIVMVERRGNGWIGTSMKTYTSPHPTRIPPS